MVIYGSPPRAANKASAAVPTSIKTLNSMLEGGYDICKCTRTGRDKEELFADVSA